MRKFLLFIPLVLFLVLGVIFFLQLGKDTQYMPSALIGKKVPDFTLVSLVNNKLVTQADLPKGPFLINFWGTWCPACHIEHPYLIALAKSGITLVGIDYKDESVSAKNWLAEKGNPYKMVLMDEMGVFGVDMGVTGAPETFVVNGLGTIVYRHQGEINEQNWQQIKGYLR